MQLPTTQATKPPFSGKRWNTVTKLVQNLNMKGEINQRDNTISSLNSSARCWVPFDVLSDLACVAIQPQNSVQKQYEWVENGESDHHPRSNVVGSDAEGDVQCTNKTNDAACKVVNSSTL